MLKQKEEQEKLHILETQQAFNEGYKKGLNEINNDLRDLAFSWDMKSMETQYPLESEALKRCSEQLFDALGKAVKLDALKALDGLDAEIPDKTESVQTWLAQLREALERKK